ncbi:uncharacterized protein LOC115721757 isoform X2 [Cannabis sativa]|uniref:RecQ-mediated genome instability protein 2 n=1 Tax=Cannabis sativa TaxID=3483 RepID=A0A7J6H6S8_CANSA|nr:uncharacterized protein LOC115721757 isoform X2 [Cannabis sativa]KAF4361668.1 hypothetical protein G4B88_015291 [Cannabis sativa]KAF4390270.1 hypothetical protein F8388_019925 [Cannabis sativa]
MNYELAALKVFCEHLKKAHEISSPSQKTMSIGGILFQRAWLQGVLVSVSNNGDHLLLDDGTGLIQLSPLADSRVQPWKIGMYVMVVGGYVVCPDDYPMIKKPYQHLPNGQ